MYRPIPREWGPIHLFTVYRPIPREWGLFTVYRPPSLGMGPGPIHLLLSVEHTDASVFFTEYLPERCL